MNIETTPFPIPTYAEVDYTVSVKFLLNITPVVACRKVNACLLMNVGNMLSAGEPTLLVDSAAYWRVPVYCAYPEFKRREYLGDVTVNAQSGEIGFIHSPFASAAEIEARADAVYHSLAASSARV